MILTVCFTGDEDKVSSTDDTECVLQIMRIRSAAQMILNVCFTDNEDKVSSTDDTECLFYR